MVKLIVFSDKNKFSNLLYYNCSNEEFKNKYFDAYSEEVIYVSKEGDYEFGSYNLQKIEEYPIIILRDTFENGSITTDLDVFCILRHTTTPNLYAKLSEKCNGRIIKQQEEEKYEGEETIYYHLSKFIGNKENITYASFFEQYIKPKIDIAEEKSILDLALEFLHTCLAGNGNVATLENQEFDNYAEIKNLFNKSKGRCTEELRDAVLKGIKS